MEFDSLYRAGIYGRPCIDEIFDLLTDAFKLHVSNVGVTGPDIPLHLLGPLKSPKYKLHALRSARCT